MTSVEPTPPLPQLASLLYYEVHVTIDPVLDEGRLKVLNGIATWWNFRVAELLMRKGGRNPEDSFLTSRDQSYPEMRWRTENLIRHLRQYGFVIRRYKLEDTLVDSKIEDRWGLL